jgi:molecular chaperone Hsp33
MLRALGPGEVYAALREQGEVVVKDDICNRDYRFDARAIDELFRDSPSPTPPTLH